MQVSTVGQVDPKLHNYLKSKLQGSVTTSPTGNTALVRPIEGRLDNLPGFPSSDITIMPSYGGVIIVKQSTPKLSNKSERMEREWIINDKGEITQAKKSNLVNGVEHSIRETISRLDRFFATGNSIGNLEFILKTMANCCPPNT